MSEKIAIYTCVFGGFDEIRPILNYRDEGKYDFYCITDNPNFNTQQYKQKVVEKPFLSNRKSCRFHKVLIPDFLKTYGKVIYHDGNLQLDYNHLDEMLDQQEDGTLCTFKHEKRNCAYDEILACLYHRKENKWRLLFYALRLWLKKYPKNNTLYETGILIRDVKNYSNSKLSQIWWYEINKYTIRDQLSLGYALKKTNYSVSIIPGFQFKNKFTQSSKHVILTNSDHKNLIMIRIVYKLIVIIKQSKRVS